MKYYVRNRAIEDAVPVLTRRKRCVRCNRYFLPSNRDHILCGSCFTDMIGSTPNRVFTSKTIELKQKLGNQTHLMIKCCEKCQLPFITPICYSKKYCDECAVVKNKEDTVKFKKEQSKECLDSWESYFKDKTVCEICGKEIKLSSGNRMKSIAFDHRHSGTAAIKSSPTSWLQNNKKNPENQKIWESCDFGILCNRCNSSIPTKNRKQWLEKLENYIK